MKRWKAARRLGRRRQLGQRAIGSWWDRPVHARARFVIELVGIGIAVSSVALSFYAITKQIDEQRKLWRQESKQTRELFKQEMESVREQLTVQRDANVLSKEQAYSARRADLLETIYRSPSSCAEATKLCPAPARTKCSAREKICPPHASRQELGLAILSLYDLERNRSPWLPPMQEASMVRLPGVTAPDVNLFRAKLQFLDLSESNLAGVFLKEADLTGASLSHANLSGAILQFATLENAWLFLTVADGASFHNARLRGAVLQKLSARGADFAYLSFEPSQLAYADLSEARFSKVSFKRSFLNTALEGADLRDTRLEQLDLDRACCSESTRLPVGLSKASCLDNARRGMCARGPQFYCSSTAEDHKRPECRQSKGTSGDAG